MLFILFSVSIRCFSRLNRDLSNSSMRFDAVFNTVFNGTTVFNAVFNHVLNTVQYCFQLLFAAKNDESDRSRLRRTATMGALWRPSAAS